MKSCAIACAICLSISGPAFAQDKIVSLNGQDVSIMPAPAEVEGRYLYEKSGEPIVELRADGTGLFQPHKVPPIPISYWLLSDGNGVPVKQVGNGNHQYTIVLQYGPGGGGNYPEGSYDAFYWTTDNQAGCAVILGERFRCN